MNSLQIAVLELEAVLQSNKYRENRVNSTFNLSQIFCHLGEKGKLKKKMPYKAVF